MNSTEVLPNTFIVGAPKSGTTYLAGWLGLSPDVFVPAVKEPGFFMEAEYYARGLSHYARQYYRQADGEQIVVDATPWYLYPESVPQRIARSISGSPRIIAVLREPVARTFSMYYDQVGRRREHRDLEQVVADELAVADPVREVAREAGPDLTRHYVLCGRYVEPLRRYYDTFGPDSICVLLAEEMWRDPESARVRLQDFLGVELPAAPERAANPASQARLSLVEGALSRAELTRSPLRAAVARMPVVASGARVAMEAIARWNQREASYPPPDPALRARLRAWFAPAVVELEGLLGRSLDPWR